MVFIIVVVLDEFVSTSVVDVVAVDGIVVVVVFAADGSVVFVSFISTLTNQ
jgi:hypothetical protein